MRSATGVGAVIDPGWIFRASCVVTLVGGTMFLLWLGEQITSRGIGNGVSLIIFSGIVANLPRALGNLLELGRTGGLSPVFIVVFLVLGFGVIAFIVFMERAQRRVVIQYPKRQVGSRMFGGDATAHAAEDQHVGRHSADFRQLACCWCRRPFRAFPATSTLPAWVPPWAGERLTEVTTQLAHGQPLYMALYAGADRFLQLFLHRRGVQPGGDGRQPEEIWRLHSRHPAGQRHGATISTPILTRLTTIGALYLVAVCLLPEILISKYGVPFYFGGTSLMIIVSVTMDTITQMQSHLLAHQYEGLIKKARVKGRGR